MKSLSNQYAAMPSLHIAWAAWCALAIWPVLRRRWTRALFLLYPFVTLFAVVVTANHYWLDGLGGLLALGLGVALTLGFEGIVGRIRHSWHRGAGRDPATGSIGSSPTETTGAEMTGAEIVSVGLATERPAVRSGPAERSRPAERAAPGEATVGERDAAGDRGPAAPGEGAGAPGGDPPRHLLSG
jgi:hypothetical protein